MIIWVFPGAHWHADPEQKLRFLLAHDQSTRGEYVVTGRHAGKGGPIFSNLPWMTYWVNRIDSFWNKWSV